jgi:thioredoxin-dependent adenylylsulfate APS reductase
MIQQKEDVAQSVALTLSEDVHELAAEYESRPPQDVIAWALDRFVPILAIATSFQAAGMVILDMAHRIDPRVRLFTIDTGRLPRETYELMDEVRERYGIPVEVYFPDPDDLAQMARKHGVNPFYRSVSLRLLCCNIRKVNPLNRALKDLDAWITGLRRSQGETRADTAKIEIDAVHGSIIKVNPLADWSDDQVWEYIRANQVPYNKLYDKGFTSIGCDPCTRPIKPGEDSRAGRWWWEKDMPKECGIHVGPTWGRTS